VGRRRRLKVERPITDILVEDGLLSREQLSEILGARTDTTEPIGDLLVRLGRITEKDRIRCLGKQRGVAFVDLAKIEIDPEIARLIPHSMALRLRSVPVSRDGSALALAMTNPLDIAAIDEVHLTTGLEIEPLIATEDDIKEAILRSYGAGEDMSEIIGEAIKGVEPGEIRVAEEESTSEAEYSLNELKEMVEGAPVVKLVNAIISKAIAARASDIHIEPEPRRVRVRYRVDGMMSEAMSIPKDLQHSVASRIKVMGNMDIAERRAPQDGRITLVTQTGHYDFRISTYPSIHGENLVIRILDKSAANIGIPNLGMKPEVLERFEQLIRRPHGMILAAGPTGSGKTTTLYAALHELNSAERNIITIEDPVEYQLPGVVQGNVNPKAGVTFASGLRTIVRQDPDVVLVGEIRDRETAEIATEAALTGHLVLSTLHTNDAAGAVSRLTDMGIEPFLIASSLIGVSAQRLVRVICPKCSVPYSPPEKMLSLLGLDPDMKIEYKIGNGCEYCNRTGYRGRKGVFELLAVSPEVQALILARASSGEIREEARAAGMQTLRENAVEKIKAGLTTPEEVLRVTSA
jgi:type IV pilus assembly protein PilB